MDSELNIDENLHFTQGFDIVSEDALDKFPEESKQDLNGLLYLGYLTDRFEKFGHTFTIKTLTRGERMAVSILVKEWEGSLGMADAYEAAMVAASLVEVDGRSLYTDLEPDADPLIRIRQNFNIVRRWYDPVLVAIYERITVLAARQERVFQNFLLQYGPTR